MTDRLYHFRFDGIKDPITIKAPNSDQARTILQQSNLPAQYKNKKITGQTTSNLIAGISHMTVNGKTAIWDGHAFVTKE